MLSRCISFRFNEKLHNSAIQSEQITEADSAPYQFKILNLLKDQIKFLELVI